MAKPNPPTSAAPPRRNNNKSPRNRPARPSKHRRTRNPWPFVLIGVVVIAAVALLAWVLTDSSSPNHSAVNAKTPQGVKYYGALGPEGVPVQIGTVLAPRNAALSGTAIDGVACNSSEQTAYHHHVHVAIFVNGQLRPIPLGVGMAGQLQTQSSSAGDFATGASGCLYWLHVHAQDGIVHIESPTQKPYYLGQVFALWGQTLSANQIGDNKGPVTVTVDGRPWTGDPNLIPLNEHDQIVMNLGTPSITPIPISWSGTGL
jgi:hypothetical protein